MLIAIGVALIFSFSTLSKDRYEYAQLEDGTYRLNAFYGQKNDRVLSIDFVLNEENPADTEKTVSSVRQYAVTGNDSLCFVFIGKDVTDIEKTAFFYCTSLCAFFVTPENENYMSEDGILYRKENGKATEALICPQQHTKYMTALENGETIPQNEQEAETFALKFSDEKYSASIEKTVNSEESKIGKTVIIPESVTKIGQLCFAYCDKITEIILPAGLKEIETMAFFKCSSLVSVELPDGLEIIGSDAFSKCGSFEYLFIPKSVKYIGHHAFFECGKIEKVYMEAADTDAMELGEKWIPQYRKTFLKNREIIFNAQRGVK